MTECSFRKEFGSLKPDDETAHKVISHIGTGHVVIADIKDPRRRSTKQHRFWFVMATLLYESQEYFKDFDDYRAALLIKMGYRKEYQMKDGTPVLIAKSLKFGNMEQTEFTALVDATLDFAESIGFDRDELLKYTQERAGWTP